MKIHALITEDVIVKPVKSTWMMSLFELEAGRRKQGTHPKYPVELLVQIPDGCGDLIMRGGLTMGFD